MSISPPETPYDSLKDENKSTGTCYIYNGISMNPTLHDGHLLYIRPNVRNLTVGDVIVYEDLVKKMNVVHRIVAISDQGLITRGDNNPVDDPLPVLMSQVLGKVQSAENGSAIKEVRGGCIGLWEAKLKRMLRALSNKGTFYFGFPYRALRNSRLFVHLWHPVIVKVHVQTNEGSYLIKYIHKHRTVAVWSPVQRRFNCSKPFDLVLFPPNEKVK